MMLRQVAPGDDCKTGKTQQETQPILHFFPPDTRLGDALGFQEPQGVYISSAVSIQQSALSTQPEKKSRKPAISLANG
jgi:hypothetical protein